MRTRAQAVFGRLIGSESMSSLKLGPRNPCSLAVYGLAAETRFFLLLLYYLLLTFYLNIFSALLPVQRFSVSDEGFVLSCFTDFPIELFSL